MRTSLRIMLMTATLGLAGNSTQSAHAQCGAHGDILVGRTASGQLKIGSAEFTLGDPVVLCPVDGMFLVGFTNGNPGFDAAEVVDDPGSDFFRLENGAEIHLEALSLEPALKVWGPGLSPLVDEPGEQIFLGDEVLHEHVTWHVDSTDPNFDAGQISWEAEFKLVDTGVATGYADSATFAITFVPDLGETVPAMSEWGMIVTFLLLLTVGSLLLGRRSERCA